MEDSTKTTLSTSLTPTLEESKISDMKLEEEEDGERSVPVVVGAASSNDVDVNMHEDAASNNKLTAPQQQQHKGGANTMNAKVELDKEGGGSADNSSSMNMEVDSSNIILPTNGVGNNMNISNSTSQGGESNSSNNATTTTIHTNTNAGLGLKRAVEVGGEAILYNKSSASPTSSTMTATANKLTGVSSASSSSSNTTNPPPSTAAAAAAAAVPNNNTGGQLQQLKEANNLDRNNQTNNNNTATTINDTNNNNISGNNNNNNSSNKTLQQPSFSMTLAIGPKDTQRVFKASKAFNLEIQKLQQRQQKNQQTNYNNGVEKRKSPEGEGSSGMILMGDTVVETSASAISASAASITQVDKKKPAIVHSPPSRAQESLLRPPVEPPALPLSAAFKISDPKQPPIVSSGTTITTAITTSNKHQAAVSCAVTTLQKQSPQQQPQQQPLLRNVLIPAATNTNDALIRSFLLHQGGCDTSSSVDNNYNYNYEGMKQQQQQEMFVQTCLIFFLDADKSTKLLAAFDVLSQGQGGEGGGGGGGGGGSSNNKSLGVEEEEEEKEDSASKQLVQRQGLICLFQSFLTSISTCVHGDDNQKGVLAGAGGGGGGGGENNNNPSGVDGSNNKGFASVVTTGRDWKGSDRTQKEILEVATFAAQNLIDYAVQERQQGEGGGGEKGDDDNNSTAAVGVSFDIFGKWYNSGGFSLVPWLELLDLSKWDYTGTNKSSPTTASASGGTGTAASSSAGAGGTALAASSTKRARIAEPFTPGVSNMNEPIGSPTSLFASGSMIGATPQPPHQTPSNRAVYDEQGERVQTFSAMFGEMSESRTVVSFDFSGSAANPASKEGGGGSAAASFHIDITEENLVMLRNLVKRTGFASLAPQQVEELMMKHARCERHQYGETVYVISRTAFGKFIREVVPKDASRKFDPTEIENFSNYFTNFFTCFDYSWSELKKDEVNAKELMVGFSFLFAGNKSSKLAAAYDMLDVDNHGYLTQRGLMQYLRSYLTMLAGISLLSANKQTTTMIRKQLMSPKRDDAFLAVENGAKWTLSHFLRAFEAEHAHRSDSTRSNAVAFEDFAKWYTEGGYAVAPWLELLDLQKFLSLIGENASSKYPDPANNPSLAEVLFTFPLANSRNLVVLRDDAQYVRSVVNDLSLLSLTSEDIWSVLFNDVSKGIMSSKPHIRKSIRMEVDQKTFVQCMMRILSGTGKLKAHSSWSDLAPEETLKNFYLSFDLSQSNRVALNQLMCGLTLLCGGKKSNKLVFAFGLFGGEDSGRNGKKKASMSHNDFFFFFRSFLIVMFSCCNQSLNLSAELVTQYISDTAKSVADDVMAYWKAKKVDKVKFENFSEWYNEGGFETAPWLELLDLNKWVLADQVEEQQKQHSYQATQPPKQQALQAPATPAPIHTAASAYTPGLTPGHEAIKALLASPHPNANGSSPDCPPAPPDDDPLFDLDLSAVDAATDEMVSFDGLHSLPGPHHKFV